MKTQRRHDIDWLRVIAIWLLLIYHIAIVFQPWAMFFGFIRSNDLIEGLWTPMTMLNVWRIPFLFYVSGMGVFFALRKRTLKQLITERVQRILVPFIFGFLAITPLHLFIFQRFYNLPLDYHAHAGHLWFLANIFLYVLILSPLFIYLRNREDRFFRKKLSAFMSTPLGPLSITLFFVAEVLIMEPGIFELYAETMHGFVLGFLAFFFGFLFMYSGDACWQTFRKWYWLFLGLSVTLFTLRITTFDANAPLYLMAIESNLWIFGIFGIGYRFLNRPSKVLSYLSQAAYPVYILHMIALYAGSSIILPLQLPVMLKFVLIVVFTFAVCYLLYELIDRIVFLRPFFGLTFKQKKQQKSIKQESEITTTVSTIPANSKVHSNEC